MTIAFPNSKCRVLVLGASGMLGNAMARYLSEQKNLLVAGTIRKDTLPFESNKMAFINLITGIDVENTDNLSRLIVDFSPNIIINCIGHVKQVEGSYDPLTVVPLNSLLPHRLARLASLIGARLIHFSTDCVFSGKRGMYSEGDYPDAIDLYGRSKLIGEVDYPNSLTLRTSIIGHELNSAHSLVDWFLSQNGQVTGFLKAVFSGFPTVEIARIVNDFIIPSPKLSGLYHLSSTPISKYNLLSLIADVYGKSIFIKPDDSYVIDRSLDCTRFRMITGFDPTPWLHMVKKMHEFQ